MQPGFGACLILRDSELNEGIEFRQHLIDRLNAINIKKQGIEEKTRIQNVILFSELEKPENRREVVGKSKMEIENDSTFFSGISEQAFEIMDKVKPTFVERMKLKLFG